MILRLIVIILFAILVAYFSIQNTALVTLHFWQYTFPGTPVYVVILASLLVGLIIGWLMYIWKAVFSSFTQRGQEKELKGANKTIVDLTKRVHTLALENARLKGEVDEDIVDDKSL
jgi:uncharacterized integral membrane protein